MRERRDWHLLKAVHKALYSNTWPQSLRLERLNTHVLYAQAVISVLLLRLHVILFRTVLQLCSIHFRLRSSLVLTQNLSLSKPLRSLETVL